MRDCRFVLLSLVFLFFDPCSPTPAHSLRPRPLIGDASSVEALVERLLTRGAASHFNFQLQDEDCDSGVAPPCFGIEDTDDGRVLITGTTASELTAGLGWYLRRFCNMTIGWPRGGGSNLFIPDQWPAVGPRRFSRQRNSPFSYLMNVCTHSYSLVWYSWKEWEAFIDWMALSGINLMLAMTGQEEVQYKVFRKLGVADESIRSWFNGPALLTWSRGQNEYGGGILGPLPRSWMRDQWNLQRKILPRLRSLGIVGQLPGFQGNVPVQLKTIYNDTNMTEAGATGWIDSLDPFFGKIADMWMETIIADFGTDHWYQLDGYFNGGVPPWFASKESETMSEWHHQVPLQRTGVQNEIERDLMAFRRATSAYTGLNRTDPNAVWSYQGWAIVDWDSLDEAKTFKGFADSVPPGKFVVIDMSRHGEGEWKQFNASAFFGVNFVYTSLHNFGGTDGLKGDLSVVNKIPFNVPSHANVIGTGATPEGIDQNTIYYEFIFEQNFRSEPVKNVADHAVERSHRRYGLSDKNTFVAQAWILLTESAYSTDLSVQDPSGVKSLPGTSSWFQGDRKTPQPALCKIYRAWEELIKAIEDDSGLSNSEPFVYDLINTGREVLANIATPASMNFSDAFSRDLMDKADLIRTGSFHMNVLEDLDSLVGTDNSFLLGPWIDSARKWGTNRYDCPSSILGTANCDHFMEWNARTQITTWNPTSKADIKIPAGPIDYAGKHWNGLIKDYYAERSHITLQQALRDQAVGHPLNTTAINLLRANLAYNWTTSTKKYPSTGIGDPSTLSRSMHDKYRSWFSSCTSGSGPISNIK